VAASETTYPRGQRTALAPQRHHVAGGIRVDDPFNHRGQRIERGGFLAEIGISLPVTPFEGLEQMTVRPEL
jgi:hypothetical protein